MIRLRLLGGVDLRGPDSRELGTVLAQPKRLALLAYLAAATGYRIHSRDTLLALLWPELDQGRARAALRQALHVLRRTLGGGVVVCYGDAAIGLDQGKLWCDAAEFEQALEGDDLVAALGLYRGELLAGFHLSGVPEFEHWLEQERARLATRASAATWALVDREDGNGDVPRALHWMLRLRSMCPDDERALRREVTLLYRLGDRLGAIRVYREFARRIAADYGVEPTDETKALMSMVRSPTGHARSTV
jgi:DNA-binding SARP family transcriptional activator